MIRYFWSKVQKTRLNHLVIAITFKQAKSDSIKRRYQKSRILVFVGVHLLWIAWDMFYLYEKGSKVDLFVREAQLYKCWAKSIDFL